ncbi:DUF4843 domain-containing protein [Mangrovibacterium diazotrophicum]|uniref:Uncharacterized protein DUF4843 n=1 Tax=Mangrovibacterium diazotrophicum TaxID=1261403 RepID=A0A419WBF3_9BACT|nr:DUF4843 domain-containing protein [Mangrovibacterium diazotrophicum]RKD92787.1 uncharacterized protein DUF4843 [Mangrovibacterium diazotrophicum]
MKKLTYILVLLTFGAFLNSCSDDPEFTKNLNFISFEIQIPTIVVEKEGTTEATVHVYSTQKTGSDRTFSVEVVEDATTANPESYSIPATVTIPANSSVGTITVTAVDNNLGEDPVTIGLQIADEIGLFTGDPAELTIQKHCELDINEFVGTYSGETMGGWGSTNVVTSLDGDGNLQITGVGVSFLTGYWGEEIVTMETLPVDVDLESGEFTIEEAAYITTTWDGAPQPTYYLSAHGFLNACSGTMYLYYDFNQAGVGSYVEYFGDQDYFTEIISIE